MIGVTTTSLNDSLYAALSPSVYNISTFERPPPSTTTSGSSISITFAKASPKLFIKFSFHSGLDSYSLLSIISVTEEYDPDNSFHSFSKAVPEIYDSVQP